ncbi:cobalt-zinc-cadmium resistance protein CzcA [Methylomagnum ishizawai]|uniref:Cobalt-zinc-cadmium resistance protein CzcA n=1 Tax=Methylomagnum ishizawai TaxID=1760988 RepID=A0A1Y6D4X1_9GAMM|nr:CusA/CzcA family heavy metal efflux RND transporter [Methylomagnum ishizawai]SMF95424.1 cobalt-zinc-cadmium resistance protein CzcA [Methylomagnum ishizawai]
MIPFLIRAALRYRWIVLIGVVALSLLGVWTFTQMKIDAYPDISAQMVQVITTYPGRAPEEVERQVTLPVEIAMRNVPKVETIRSRTIFGLSVVQMIFEEGTESYWARQRVQEKLSSLDLPDGADAEMGPLATAYGEVLRYELVSDGRFDLMELRTLNDWVVIPRLLRAAGVAEVANFGGYAKQHGVLLNPAQLQRYGLSVNDVVDAIQTNNQSAGGSVLSRGSMSFVIRGRGALQDEDEIGSIFIKSIGGTPIYVRDVAEVRLDAKVPAGIFSKDRTDEAVEGIVLLRKGENPSEVLARVETAIAELNGEGLPEGAKVAPYYDRSHLIDSTLHTVGHSVGLGIGLVLLVLLAFFGRPSLALLVALTIPFSLLFALVMMYLAGIPIGLLSIGAIDFGIIVDGAVIMCESIARRLDLREHQPETERASVPHTVLAAALDVERPVFFSILMIVGAFLPLLTLTRIEGLLFRPMALTLVFALAGAALFALLAVPVLSAFLFRKGFREWENPALHWLSGRYAALLGFLLRQRWPTVAGAGVLLVAVLATIVPRLGTEFLPYMDEGVVWVRANFPEGTSLQMTAHFGQRLREIALEFPDIEFAAAQTGRNDSGTDPYPPSRIEMMVGPKPSDSWTQFQRKQELVAALGARFRAEFPTTRFNFTQPIIDSVTEDTNGTSANMAIEFSGADSDVLLDLARRAEILLKQVPGAVDVNIEQEGPQPQLVIQPDRSLCARYNVRIEDVTRLVDTAIGGAPIGSLFEGERRFDIVSRFAPEYLRSPQALGRLPVYNADGIPIPLAQVARIDIVDGQTMIARADGRRRLTVRSDIVGRDQGGFVAEAQHRFEGQIQVPPGYRATWLGMFENLKRAGGHFALLVPVTIAVIYVLLLAMFASQRAALILLLAIPFAFVGGAVALHLRGMNLNVSSGVGFAAVFGVSIMNGVLIVRTITDLRLQGTALEESILRGSVRCLRPILIASLVAILGLVPASLATGLGSDVQRPLATVIVWGLFSATVMTLLLVPVLYRLFVPRLPVADNGRGEWEGI